jgi:hypothetical protein
MIRSYRVTYVTTQGESLPSDWSEKVEIGRLDNEVKVRNLFSSPL